jgi:hypothetical protein
MRENRKNDSKVLPELPQRCARVGGGGETPSELESSGDDEHDEDEEEGEIIFTCSPLPVNLPSPGDLFGWQMGSLLVPVR